MKGTKAEAVRFHDNKNGYTGVHKQGGPSITDNKISLRSLADRSDADVRGVKLSDKRKAGTAAKKTPSASPSEPMSARQRAKTLPKNQPKSNKGAIIAGTTNMFSQHTNQLGFRPDTSGNDRNRYKMGSAVAKGGGKSAESEASGGYRKKTGARTLAASPNRVSSTGKKSEIFPNEPKKTSASPTKKRGTAAGQGEDLKAVFLQFCRYGDQSNTGKMNGTKFFKFVKDCKLLDSKVTRTRVDMLFAKTKAKGSQTVTLMTFMKMISELADMKFGKTDASATDKLLILIAKNGHAKASSGTTKTTKTRFHDDKSGYTGVHKHGGPKIMDSPGITFSRITDRSDANVRGVNKKYDVNK